MKTQDQATISESSEDQNTPARARGRATRSRIVSAGVEAFSEVGFHGTRVDDIVTGAGISHGTFYLYFASKDDLFQQLVSDIIADFRSLTSKMPAIRDDAAGMAALTGWLEEFIEKYRRFGPLIRSWTDAESPEDGGESSDVPDLLATISTELAAKVKIRKSQKLDPEIAALAVVAMVERMNYLLETIQVEGSTNEVAGVLAAIAMDAFFGPGH